jgi:hypothetical protein
MTEQSRDTWADRAGPAGTSHQDSGSASAMLSTWTLNAELGLVVRLVRYGTWNLGPDLLYVATSSLLFALP